MSRDEGVRSLVKWKQRVGDEAECEALAGTDNYGRAAWPQATDVNSAQQGCTSVVFGGASLAKGRDRLPKQASKRRVLASALDTQGLPTRTSWQADSQKWIDCYPFSPVL